MDEFLISLSIIFLIKTFIAKSILKAIYLIFKDKFSEINI